MKRERDGQEEEQLSPDEILKIAKKRDPSKEYRISSNGHPQFKNGKEWRSMCQHGRRDRCTKCGAKSVCEHHRIRSSCKDCDGNGICEHKHIRTSCKECGGGSICEHKRIRTSCKECGGGSICEHKRIRAICKECDGGSICEHKRTRSKCKECDGGGICEHKRVRTICKDCDGGGLCKHKRVRSVCKECGGGSVCEHKRVRFDCSECGGGRFCEHGYVKYVCMECDGSQICEHKRIRRSCKECGGSSICEHNIHRALCVECGNGCINQCGKTKQDGGYCTTCHPDYIPTMAGKSKVACRFFDALEKELGHSIEHFHYDYNTKQCIGSEHKIPEWPKKRVDGYYAPNVVIEFLGDYYHGHPITCPNDVLFTKTEHGLKKLKALGYTALYIWESDFKKRKALQSIHSLCRTFEDKLEW